MYPDHLRRTGRTTRLVVRALIKAATGKHVAYVVYNRAMIDHVKRQARELCGGELPPTFTVTTFQAIATLRHAGRREVFFIDHFYDHKDRHVWQAVDWMHTHAEANVI